MYSIIWKYTIKPENKERFELQYGPSGIWAKLFSESKQFLGSYMHRNTDIPDTYLIIDTWDSKESYDDFAQRNADIYSELSEKFKSIYLSEEKMGNFSLVEERRIHQN